MRIGNLGLQSGRFFNLVLLATILTGCMVGPNFSSPEVPIQKQWMECTNDFITCGDSFRVAWWTYFNDPVVDQLIELAVEQNFTLKTACWRVLESRAELGFSIGEFFPQLQEAVGSATRFKVSKNAPNSRFSDLQYWDFITGLQAAWELDFWGRFRRGIESAEESYIASFANYEDILVFLLGDVATNYVTIRTIESRIEIVKKNIALQQRSLEIVEARWKAGVVTELDVQQAKNLLYDSRARLPVLENDLRVTKNALAVLLGLPPDRVDCILTKPGPIPQTPHSLSVGIPAQLLCRRPDVRRAFHVAAAQSARIGIAVSDLLPRLSIRGFIDFESSADTRATSVGGGGNLFESKSLTYFFGIN